jgi:hypothetical protein
MPTPDVVTPTPDSVPLHAFTLTAASRCLHRIGVRTPSPARSVMNALYPTARPWDTRVLAGLYSGDTRVASTSLDK